MIALPPHLLWKAAMAKSIFDLQKKAARSLTPFVYPLQILQEPEALKKLMLNLKNWKKENSN
ncbi:hypothetical protein ACJBWA_11045 [Streptococcus suis]